MIQTETTPNPESLKFLSENTISSIGTEEFRKKDIDKINNTFIKQLLNFKGVDLVLLSKNFLSVKKTKDITWEELKPMVISHLNHYYQKNKEPILNKSLQNVSEEKNDTIKKIKDVLDTKIRPAVAKDGGDIKFKEFKNGVVKVQLQGSCSGCPSSTMTLKRGVQNLLCHYLPEVKSVEAI